MKLNDMMLCMISLVIEFNVLSISSPNISLAVVKEKAPTETAKLFVNTTLKHKTAFLMLKFTVFFFWHFEKRFQKSRKSLENSAFYVVSCKPVISDKW